MRIVLVGADFEENLGIGMVAAVARDAGHEVVVVPFDEPEALREVAAQVVASHPDVVGLGIQFQHRALEFLTLARELRALGLSAHVTAGGQFPTLAWREVLEHEHGVDSVVLHEGERSFVALLAALAAGAALAEVPGLAVRADDGAAMRTPPSPLVADLDTLPFPLRYRAHARHCGVPFIPVMGSRGCWGRCSYCSITTFYRDARAHGGGHTLRHRSVENLAAEMGLLWHHAGGPSLFCFHDDNFLLPRPADSLARLEALRAALDAIGVGEVGMIGKCRPDSLTPALAKRLRALGVIRLYVGVENASQAGADHLGRRTQNAAVRAALAACREAGIFVCYNLLVFEPDATVADLRTNVAFVREHAAHPVNFCRAEAYFGTPLHRDLEARRALGGSYLGFNYRIEDPRVETIFRVCAAAFRQRNFDALGVANRTMGLGYSAKILEYFHAEAGGRRAALSRRADELTRAISLETAGLLEEAIDLVERHFGDDDRIARETALLGLRIAACDRDRHAALDELYDELEAYGARAGTPRAPLAIPSRLWDLARGLAVSASLALGASGCTTCGMVVDPPPPPQQPTPPTKLEPGPITPPTRQDPLVPVDPPPPDRPVVVDPVPADPTPGKLQPGRIRQRVHPRDPAPPPPDPLPRPADPVPIYLEDPVPPPPDPLPSPRSYLAPSDGAPLVAGQRSLPIVDRWRDTAPRAATRTTDLPLHAPPQVSLRTVREGALVRVTLVGGPARMSTRWEASGELEGAGREVVWRPDSPVDQLRVAVRTEGGVAITSVRARDA